MSIIAITMPEMMASVKSQFSEYKLMGHDGLQQSPSQQITVTTVYDRLDRNIV